MVDLRLNGSTSQTAAPISVNRHNRHSARERHRVQRFSFDRLVANGGVYRFRLDEQ